MLHGKIGRTICNHTKTIKKERVLHSQLWFVSIDPAAQPPRLVVAHRGLSRRGHPDPIRASSSRASAQDDARWQRQIPSNYYYYPYHYHYHYHYRYRYHYHYH